jgi:DNA-binding CsgD family transcriptional regulator
MRTLGASSRLVADAFAGVLLFHDGCMEPMPGMRGDDLLAMHSVLLATIDSRLISGELHMSFLWPRDSSGSTQGHVRVTYLAVTDAPLPDLRGIVLLSSVGPAHHLTSRELEVLGMIVDGYSNQQIAQRLVVTARTVAAHVEHILAKLASPTRTHAAVWAQREGNYVPVPARG